MRIVYEVAQLAQESPQNTTALQLNFIAKAMQVFEGGNFFI